MQEKSTKQAKRFTFFDRTANEYRPISPHDERRSSVRDTFLGVRKSGLWPWPSKRQIQAWYLQNNLPLNPKKPEVHVFGTSSSSTNKTIQDHSGQGRAWCRQYFLDSSPNLGDGFVGIDESSPTLFFKLVNYRDISSNTKQANEYLPAL